MKPKIVTFDIEPYYHAKVYSTGKVKVFSNSKYSKGRELSQWETADGYMRTKISGKNVMVHTIVALNILGDRPDGLVINHIDGCKHNNHPDNLEYVTIAENIKHSVAMGFHVSNDPKRSGRYKDGRATKSNLKEYKRKWARDAYRRKHNVSASAFRV